MSGDVFPIYEALWARAEQLGAVVHYDGHREAEAAGYAGYFQANERPGEKARPAIAIVRPYYEQRNKPTRGLSAAAPSDRALPDLLSELVTLAHEFGHFKSWDGVTPHDEWLVSDAVGKRRGEIDAENQAAVPMDLPKNERNDRMRTIMLERLTDDDRRRLLQEEALAWRIGREILTQLGFDDFMTFDKHEARSMHAHRYRLGIEDLWPDEVEVAANE